MHIDESGMCAINKISYIEISENANSTRRPVQYKKSVTSGRLANISNYEDVEFNNNGTEDR